MGVTAAAAAAATADAIDGRHCCCSGCRCCHGCHPAITYVVCGSPIVSAVTAAVTAAGAQVPPAADGEGSSYYRLLRAALCHIGKKYFRLTQFAVDRRLVKNIGRIH